MTYVGVRTVIIETDVTLKRAEILKKMFRKMSKMTLTERNQIKAKFNKDHSMIFARMIGEYTSIDAWRINYDTPVDGLLL